MAMLVVLPAVFLHALVSMPGLNHSATFVVVVWSACEEALSGTGTTCPTATRTLHRLPDPQTVLSCCSSQCNKRAKYEHTPNQLKAKQLRPGIAQTLSTLEPEDSKLGVGRGSEGQS